ncbi:MAG: glycosyltransferase [Ancalomicrobiaceae bacterium]|nr:glycosyltransferase [Ancalomicrobiaceae bacterium]
MPENFIKKTFLGNLVGRPRIEFREQGDRARDIENWKEAADAYLKYLSGNPDDFDIWVQAGNCLKEAKDFDGASDAYKQAIALKQDDADVHLQFGHLMKLEGRKSDAMEAYRTSYLLKPSKGAKTELVALGDDLTFSTQFKNAGKLTFFEIDDFFNYMKAHKALSGIQRVQVAISDEILKNAGDKAADVAFVLRGHHQDTYYAIEPNDLRNIIKYVTGARVSHELLRGMIARAESAAAEVVPSQGDVYVILGAFWGYGGIAARYNQLKAVGVAVGVYIYDVIPYSHPEFCEDRLVHDFVLSLADGLAIFDFVLTISEFTASEVKRIIKRFDLPQRPVKAVPLAHLLSFEPSEPSRLPARLTAELSVLSDRPYVLYVSTIEGRKNHAYVVSIWKQLILEGVDMPDLVFVGRQGWRIAGLMEVLTATNNLAQRLHIFHDVSDAQLQALYDNCMFTTFTSFVEGWGLPVGESLSHGKLCVASNCSSIPEVGGTFADYVDPLNVQAGIDTIRKLVTDPDYLEKRSAEIRSGFVARSWADVTRDFLAKLEASIAEIAEVRPIIPSFPAGKSLHLGELSYGNAIPSDYFKYPVRLLINDGWLMPESFGVWMEGADATLTFGPALEMPEDNVLIFLGVVGAPLNQQEAEISVAPGNRAKTGAGDVSRKISLRPEVSYLKLEARPDVNGRVVLRFRVLGEIIKQPNDQREFALGLTMLAYCGRKDIYSRLDIYESIVMSST